MKGVLLRALGSALSPGGTRGRLGVLIYHRVLAETAPLSVGETTLANFRWQMDLLAAHANVLPLDEALTALARGRLPPRALSITFDDGYADNATLALPELLARGLSATFFVASGFLNGGRMWNDTVIEALRAAPRGEVTLPALGMDRVVLGDAQARGAVAARVLIALKHRPPEERARGVEAVWEAVGRPALPDRLMMNSAQLRALDAAGMGIGGHTRSHPILASLDASAAREEIGGGRADLEAIVGPRVKLFAYPNGRPGADYGWEHARMVRALNFQGAVSTARGAAHAGSDPFQLPRFTPWDRTPARFLGRLWATGRWAHASVATAPAS